MPVKVSKIDGKYRVSTPGKAHALGTGKRQAERQARLLRAVDQGWTPTYGQESAAQRVVNRLLEVDEIGSVPIPASGRAYARIRGMRGLRDKQRLYLHMGRDLANPGKPVQGFKNRDASRREGLERGRVERTRFKQGKTAGKFKFPGNYRVGHAIKQ